MDTEKQPVRYDKSMLETTILHSKATLIGWCLPKASEITADDSEQLKRESTIHFTCECETTASKVFRTLVETGAYCKPCSKKTKIQYGCIYLIKNTVNDKKYVGQHNRSEPSRRFYMHINAALKGKNKTCILANAIRKYGADAFTIEILGVFPFDELDTKECYYAELHKTYIWDEPNPGYNMIWCGGVGKRRGIKPSEETKAKMSEAHKGKKIHDEAFRKRLAERNKERIFTEEDRENMSKRAIEHATPEVRKQMSATIKKKHEEDETYRKNVLEGQQKRRLCESEADKAKYRETTLKQFSTPGAKEKHRQIMLKYYENKKKAKLSNAEEKKTLV